ncbi:glutathione S-transferase [Apiospora rasikravindrae]|uniref:glutathione transferase n=1 Tax=Apiospora rasikravindrae TaxID=990691 RepID=A0ABR1RP75_9PEZI
MQPIRVWLTPPGPNPWKVVFILEELGIPYEVKSIRFEDVKKPPMIDVNPNGRVPAIEDLNTNLTLWESGAIITYLIEQYDTKHTLTYTSLADKHHLNQWLHFQMSGQGPYYGTSGWFIYLHPEKVPSAIDRYTKQVTRVLGEWLVGDKMTYADLAWVPWNDRVDSSLVGVPEHEKLDAFPNVKAWHERMTSRASWQRSMVLRAKLMDEQGLLPNGMPKGAMPEGIESYSDYVAQVNAGENPVFEQ